jgi:tetratricopeptide (TPR) repeat protein
MIHSTFSPAGMPAELLEKTFVQREKLADRLTALFAESANADSKHHVLLVGPRGIGKSHLASLVYHRLLHKPELIDKLAIAYMREDEWGIASYLDLVLRILRELGVPTNELQSFPTEVAEDRAGRMLHATVGGKTLLVILENLDAILQSLGEEGQRKWRAFMQNSGFWSLLATTPSLSRDISDHGSPFYGFFEIRPLEGLSVDDAVSLLRRLAEYQGRSDIAQYISSPAGRARVRAVQHLANGNHRIFVIFYEFLTHGQETEIVDPVLKTIDFLTPYYQSQMRELSPQQRKLVEFLCRVKSAATVKKIASSCFVSHQTAAAQLKQLLESRYLRVTRVGREAYYELNEPLLRICVETKGHSGEPIRLLVEFLRYWFARRELEQRLTAMESHVPERVYFVAALGEYDNREGHAHLSPDVLRLCHALSHAEFAQDATLIKSTAQELAVVSRIAEDWIHYTRAVSRTREFKGAVETLTDAVRKHPEDPTALLCLARMYSLEERPQQALSLIERVVELDPRMRLAWIDKGDVHCDLQNEPAALVAYSRAIELAPKWALPAIKKARLLVDMGRESDAQDVLRPHTVGRKYDPELLVLYGSLLGRVMRFREALKYFKRVTADFPDYVDAWILQGHTLVESGRAQEALSALRTALSLAHRNPRANYSYCKALFAVGQYQQSLVDLPVEVVAHRVFHELLGLINGNSRKAEIERTLSNFHSVFSDRSGADALAGGLVEFASHVHRQAGIDEGLRLQEWRVAISKVFSSDPRFEIIVKIVDAMVRYKETTDERVLLELPVEQRRLLEPDATDEGRRQREGEQNMSKNYHVVPTEGGWAVRRERSDKAGSVHDTQREAIEVGRERAIRDHGELVIHDTHGRIRDKDSYGNDPFPPRDTKH